MIDLGKRTGKLEVTSKPTLRKVVKLVPGGEGSHQSKGPLSEYRDDKKRVGIEDMKKDMLKMMDKVDRLEDAFKFLKDRVNRIDGRG